MAEGGSTVSDDAVNPAHYKQGAVECIDAIEAALCRDGFIAFLRGQVIKYTWRCEHKGQMVTDCAKTKWYQDRLVATLAKESK